MFMKQYMEKYMDCVSKKPLIVPTNVFVTRQFYSYVTKEITPELNTNCYCKEVLNPSLPIKICKKCKEFIHLSCAKKYKDQPCPGCQSLIMSSRRLAPESPKSEFSGFSEIPASSGSNNRVKIEYH